MSKNLVTSLIWIKKQNVKKLPEELNNKEAIDEMKKLEKDLYEKANISGKETIKEITEKIESSLNNNKITASSTTTNNNNNNKHNDNNNKQENEDYDDDDDFEDIPTFSSEFKNLGNKLNNNSDNNNTSTKLPNDIDDISDDDEEDYTVHPTDNLIVCSTAQDDISNLEVYIYNEKEQNLYVHHDILLSSYPLCLELLSLDDNNNVNNKINYAVVGSFLPDIEIWNLDNLDVLEPEMILGDPDNYNNVNKYYKKNLNASKNNKQDSIYHTDAVLSISLNPFDKKNLASGSADSKVIVWDLIKTQPIINYKEHFDKVQSVKFNKREDNVLLSASVGNDQSIRLFDIRSNTSAAQLKVSEDIECIEFSYLNKYKFLVSYESGIIEEYDICNMSKPLISFKAHNKACTSVSYSNYIDNMFVSCSLDSYVKVWDSDNNNNNILNSSTIDNNIDNTNSSILNSSLFNNNSINQPKLLCEKYLKKTTGELFCAKFADDIDHTIAVGGSKGELVIWQLEQSKAFCDRYNLKWLGDNATLLSDTNNLPSKRLMSNKLRLKDKKKRNAVKRIIKKKID